MTRAEMEALLAAAEERAAKATPGPWYGYQGPDGATVGGPESQRRAAFDLWENGGGLAWFQREDDAVFAAHAREDVPALCTALWQALADVARLTARVAELEALCTDFATMWCDDSIALLTATKERDAARADLAACAERERTYFDAAEAAAADVRRVEAERDAAIARAEAAEHSAMLPTRGDLINRAASLAAEAVKMREQAERMPQRTQAECQARIAALGRAVEKRDEADMVWRRVREMVETGALATVAER